VIISILTFAGVENSESAVRSIGLRGKEGCIFSVKCERMKQSLLQLTIIEFIVSPLVDWMIPVQ
jgi:hypothetical protein